MCWCFIMDEKFTKMFMRSKEEFNDYYKVNDPWGVLKKKNSRNYILRKIFKKYIKNHNSVLELACGEGNFSKYINEIGCNSNGIDISDIAIERAKKLNLKNYKFDTKDLLHIEYNSDIVLAIEVIYYLNEEERNKFFKKLLNKKITLIFSTPIIGENQYRRYFTDKEIKKKFSSLKFKLLEERNLNFFGGKNIFCRIINKILFNPLYAETYLSQQLLQIIPNNYIYQKVYVVNCG